MTLALALLLVLAQEAGPSVDVGSALALYGIAAPFAALCFWQLITAQRDVRALRLEVADLQKAALQREQQLVAGLGPRIYDAAQLFREGTELASRPPPPAAPDDDRVEHLARSVELLIQRMEAGGPPAGTDDRAR
jgi:hypothetical protein